MANFQERFRILKAEKNLTLDEIAKNIKTTKSSLSRIINGKSSLKYDLVDSLANFFGVSRAYLLGDSQSRNNDLTIDSEYYDVFKLAKENNISPHALIQYIEILIKNTKQ